MIPKVALHFLLAFQPPYKEMLAAVGGMTRARAAIFFMSQTVVKIFRKNKQ